MGLEDFSTDDKQDEPPEEDSDSEEETATEETTGGLESFRTSATRGGSTSKNDSDDEDDKRFGLPTEKRKQMTKSEWVSYVREHHIPDYYPTFQPDDRWAFERCVEISCVCGNRFTFLTSGLCLECGRQYKDAGRTVVKTQDPHEDKE